MTRQFASVAFLLIAMTTFVQAQQPADDFFNKLDRNGDGVLSGTEAKTMLSFDANGDGEVTRAEYLAGQRSTPGRTAGGAVSREAAEARFMQLDINQDGFLSGTEMAGIESYDADGDRRITLDEYVAGATAGGSSDEAVIYVPDDEQAFTVKMTDTVRIIGNGIAGSTLKIQVLGPAKIARTGALRFVQGGQMAIGGLQKEYEITPTGPGEVTVIVTVTYPTGGDAKVNIYRFRVEGGEPKA